ncbi:MAG: hypothetical protein B6241_03815 [Spirochaetaceae bacterium 4572_59]|nr:MAG: hypothetical protein B6241_03815 [Spirochaetaceae bacterium 4572_59]
MPPKAINYKANSIVYFKGDSGENVFILQKGQVSLNYQDIQTNQDMHDFVQTGEFFGVKAAFGKYPHDETAVVLVNSTVIQFSVEDFEQLLSTNNRVIMKMLKVFSNQLRRIHKQVQSLLSSEEQTNAEKGLFSVGEYYFNNKKYKQAADAFNRYLTYYPNGQYEAEVRKKIEYADMQKNIKSEPAMAPKTVENKTVQKYTLEDAQKLCNSGNYTDAYNAYIKSIQYNPNIRLEAEFEAGICLFKLEKPNDVIRHFTGILKRNPAHSKMGECLYYIGKSYLSIQDMEKSKGFLMKAISLLSEGTPEQRDAQMLVSQIGE